MAAREFGSAAAAVHDDSLHEHTANGGNTDTRPQAHSVWFSPWSPYPRVFLLLLFISFAFSLCFDAVSRLSCTLGHKTIGRLNLGSSPQYLAITAILITMLIPQNFMQVLVFHFAYTMKRDDDTPVTASAIDMSLVVSDADCDDDEDYPYHQHSPTVSATDKQSPKTCVPSAASNTTASESEQGDECDITLPSGWWKCACQLARAFVAFLRSLCSCTAPSRTPSLSQSPGKSIAARVLYYPVDCLKGLFSPRSVYGVWIINLIVAGLCSFLLTLSTNFAAGRFLPSTTHGGWVQRDIFMWIADHLPDGAYGMLQITAELMMIALSFLVLPIFYRASRATVRIGQQLGTTNNIVTRSVINSNTVTVPAQSSHDDIGRAVTEPDVTPEDGLSRSISFNSDDFDYYRQQFDTQHFSVSHIHTTVKQFVSQPPPQSTSLILSIKSCWRFCFAKSKSPPRSVLWAFVLFWIGLYIMRYDFPQYLWAIAPLPSWLTVEQSLAPALIFFGGIVLFLVIDNYRHLTHDSHRQAITSVAGCSCHVFYVVLVALLLNIDLNTDVILAPVSNLIGNQYLSSSSPQTKFVALLEFYSFMLTWQFLVRWVSLYCLPKSSSIAVLFPLQLLEDLMADLIFSSFVPFSGQFFLFALGHAAKTIFRDLDLVSGTIIFLVKRLQAMRRREAHPSFWEASKEWRVRYDRKIIRHQNLMTELCAKFIVIACFTADLLPRSYGPPMILVNPYEQLMEASWPSEQLSRLHLIGGMLVLVLTQILTHLFVLWLIDRKPFRAEGETVTAASTVLLDRHWRFHFVLYVLSIVRLVSLLLWLIAKQLHRVNPDNELQCVNTLLVRASESTQTLM